MKLINTCFALTLEEKQFTWIVMSQGFTESPYFLKILNADLDYAKFPRGSTFLQYVNDFFKLLAKPPHLLKLLALKGHKAGKEKWQFFQTHV